MGVICAQNSQAQNSEMKGKVYVWVEALLKTAMAERHTENGLSKQHMIRHSATWEDNYFPVAYSGSHLKLENSDKGDFQVFLLSPLKEKWTNNNSLL